MSKGEEKKRERELTKKQKIAFLELYPKNRYHIGATCKKVGIHRNTLLYWRKKDLEFKANLEAIEEERIDDSEERLFLLGQGIPDINKDGKLVGWVVKPHFGALQLHLKAKAKNRGYGDHITIDDNREEDYREFTEDEILEQMERMKGDYMDYE